MPSGTPLLEMTLMQCMSPYGVTRPPWVLNQLVNRIPWMVKWKRLSFGSPQRLRGTRPPTFGQYRDPQSVVENLYWRLLMDILSTFNAFINTFWVKPSYVYTLEPAWRWPFYGLRQQNLLWWKSTETHIWPLGSGTNFAYNDGKWQKILILT